MQILQKGADIADVDVKIGTSFLGMIYLLC